MPKTATKKAGKAVESLNYEQALAELESIVKQLEKGEGSLDDSMKLFERGQVLVAHCGALLEHARLKVEKLAGESLLPFGEESE